MSQSTVTSKGQVTIPKSVRERLKLEKGDLLEFREDEQGRIYIEPARQDVWTLAGILFCEGRPPVPISDMDEAIGHHCAEESARTRQGDERT